jgi:hypothetical protein
MTGWTWLGSFVSPTTTIEDPKGMRGVAPQWLGSGSTAVPASTISMGSRLTFVFVDHGAGAFTRMILDTPPMSPTSASQR